MAPLHLPRYRPSTTSPAFFTSSRGPAPGLLKIVEDHRSLVSSCSSAKLSAMVMIVIALIALAEHTDILFLTFHLFTYSSQPGVIINFPAPFREKQRVHNLAQSNLPSTQSQSYHRHRISHQSRHSPRTLHLAWASLHSPPQGALHSDRGRYFRQTTTGPWRRQILRMCDTYRRLDLVLGRLPTYGYLTDDLDMEFSYCMAMDLAGSINNCTISDIALISPSLFEIMSGFWNPVLVYIPQRFQLSGSKGICCRPVNF
ncbi:hypothetical protein BDW60DRAFT_86562 [Aspergillus nidulans var. acristatus]